MHQPFQLALNFNDSQLDNTPVSEIPPKIPIDKYFPEDEANKLAAFESYNKHLYRPISSGAQRLYDPNIPSKETFVNKLKTKLTAKMELKLEF